MQFNGLKEVLLFHQELEVKNSGSVAIPNIDTGSASVSESLALSSDNAKK